MRKTIQDISFGEDSTLHDEVLITIDTDWCSDDVLTECLDLLEQTKTTATIFVTHQTPLLDRMRDNESIELGIHPNFNPLLSGDFVYGRTFSEVIEYYLNIVPEAVSARSHSVTQSSPILNALVDAGITHDSNSFIPAEADIPLKPWRHWYGDLVRVPYSWEDYIHCAFKWPWNAETFLNKKGLKVFDFHPIHLFLNTESTQRYESAKLLQNNHALLLEHVNRETYGTRDFFHRLVSRDL